MKIGPSERGYIGRHVSIIITFHYQMETGARASADRSNTFPSAFVDDVEFFVDSAILPRF